MCFFVVGSLVKSTISVAAAKFPMGIVPGPTPGWSPLMISVKRSGFTSPYANHGAGIFTYKTGWLLGIFRAFFMCPWCVGMQSKLPQKNHKPREMCVCHSNNRFKQYKWTNGELNKPSWVISLSQRKITLRYDKIETSMFSLYWAILS